MSLWLLLALVVPGVATSQPKTATVQGRVCAADTGAPLERVRVTLQMNHALPDSALVATTNAEGRYEIQDIPIPVGASFQVYSAKSGYVITVYQQGLTLTEGQELKNVDFLLPRSGTISGTVTDEHVEPVPNVSMAAVRNIFWRGRMQLNAAKAVQTDDRGNFRLYDLPAGSYYVRASKRTSPILPVPEYGTVLYPNASKIAEAKEIDLKS